MNLTLLSNRIEAAQGADRSLAKDIFRAIYPERVPELGHPNGYGWREDEGGWWLATGEDARTPPKTIYPPNWLGSLDAAMTLVPEGWTIELTAPPINSAAPTYVRMWHVIKTTGYVRGATIALALTAACLRARALAHQGEGDV